MDLWKCLFYVYVNWFLKPMLLFLITADALFFLQQMFLQNRLQKNHYIHKGKKDRNAQKMKHILWRALGTHIKSKSRPRSAWCEWKYNIYSAGKCVWKWLVSRKDGDVLWNATLLVRKQYLLATCDQAHSSSLERRETARLHKPTDMIVPRLSDWDAMDSYFFV